MPRTPRCQLGSSRMKHPGRESAAVFELGFDGLERSSFGGAALVIEAVQFFCQLGCAGGISCEEELDDIAGDVHSAGGVDAGADAEAYFGGGGGAVRWNLRDLHEGAEAGLDGVAEFAQTECSDDAVFPVERHGVGDGGDGDELEEGGNEAAVETQALDFGIGGGLCGCEQEGVGQFEGYGGSAEIFERVGAAGLCGIDDGERFGDALSVVGEVVVGDDEVEAEGFCFGCGGEGADAGVYADDEADSGGCVLRRARWSACRSLRGGGGGRGR